MAISTGLTQAEVTNLIQQRLLAVRNALNAAAELYKWTSGLAVTDLEAASTYSATDAPGVLSAVADANALSVLANTGAAPSSYPANYQFLNSIVQVIGPQ